MGSVLLLIVSIALKSILYFYCRQFTSSPSAMALTEDHRNDVLSNSTALIAVCVASQFHRAVWADPVGGLLISLYIIYSWYTIGIEESNKLIGIVPDDENMRPILKYIERDLMINKSEYNLFAHHAGRNVILELRLCIKQSIEGKYDTLPKICDYCLTIQGELETFDFVERAFVNFDYKKRNHSLHKLPLLSV